MVQFSHSANRHSIRIIFLSDSDLQKSLELLSSIDCIIKYDSERNHSQYQSNSYGMEEKITVREKEVLLILAKGFSYSESASFLNCSVSTIQTHVKRLYRKLQVNSKSEAVYEALQLGIINL